MGYQRRVHGGGNEGFCSMLIEKIPHSRLASIILYTNLGLYTNTEL